MIKILAVALVLSIPTTAFAASSGDTSDEPPQKTKTTMVCKDGKVWDKKTQKCLDAKSQFLDDDARYKAVREMAYAGQYINAQTVLASMQDQNASRVLTYYGFIHRKSGDIELGMAYYKKALAADPDNLLVRSYMGQGFVEMGKLEEARLQLAEIDARGGSGRWPQKSLAMAIERGVGYSY